MAAIQREPASQILGQFTTPLRGTWNSAAVHAIPHDALYDSNNVFLRRGKLRNRPGLGALSPSVFDGPIIGGAMAVTPYEKRLLALSKNYFYEYSGQDAIWVAKSNVKMANNDQSIIDMAFMETLGNYVGIIACEGQPLRQWDYLTGAILPVPQAGEFAPPSAKSVCIAVRRCVALIPPHTIRWSKVFNWQDYSSLAYNKVAQTNDVGICVRSLTNTSFALYKERSIYIARAREGNDDSAFSFSEPIRVEGPAGIRAVVDVNGIHIYMTRSGRIAQFNGSGYPQWIADGLWLFLQDDIDGAYAHLITGVYDYRLHTVTFWYPRKGDYGYLKAQVCVNLPLEGADIASMQPVPAAFKGYSSTAVSHMYPINMAGIDRSLVFSSTAGSCKSFLSDERINADDGQYFDCLIRHPIIALPDANFTKVTHETFVERKQGYGFMAVYPIVSDNLEDEEGLIPDAKVQYINLERNPVQNIIAFNVTPRFYGVAYAWTSDNTVRYSGTTIYKSGGK